MLGVFISQRPQRSPVRLLVSRWHNHTPEPLKCERGQKRGVYERDRANDRTIFTIKRGFRANDKAIFIRKKACIEAKNIKKQKEEKKVDKTIDKPEPLIYNIIIKKVKERPVGAFIQG
jgi:hypothetical protein